MIKRYIQCATFRVVVHAKGDCAEEPQLPCIAFKDLWARVWLFDGERWFECIVGLLSSFVLRL